MFCRFCGVFLGVLCMESFCRDCQFLRRLYLLHDPKAFIDKVRAVFLAGEIAEAPAEEPPPQQGAQGRQGKGKS
jgi:hypothetical protein